MNSVFVCYEENKNALALESGAMNELSVNTDKDKVVEWIKNRIKVNEGYGYLIHDDTDIEKEILKENICITMFKEYQGNYEYCFDIVVLKKSIQ